MTRQDSCGRTQFEYDFDNRLVRIVYPDGKEVRYGYDRLGRRVWREEGGRVRYFFYDGDRIIAEREGNSWVVRYLLGRGPVGFVAGGGLRVYHGDRLGSVRWVTDGEQNLVVSYVYEGFGKIVGQEGGGGGPYQWCGLWGYRNDHDGGLMHVGARYYEIETGRWVQKDPWLGNIIIPQTLNNYSYATNNPINFIDPSGRAITIPVIIIVIIVGLVVSIGFFFYVAFKKIIEGIEEGEKSAGVDVPRVYERRRRRKVTNE